MKLASSSGSCCFAFWTCDAGKHVDPAALLSSFVSKDVVVAWRARTAGGTVKAHNDDDVMRFQNKKEF